LGHNAAAFKSEFAQATFAAASGMPADSPLVLFLDRLGHHTKHPDFNPFPVWHFTGKWIPLLSITIPAR
jgi:hypothetical protein